VKAMGTVAGRRGLAFFPSFFYLLSDLDLGPIALTPFIEGHTHLTSAVTYHSTKRAGAFRA